MRPIFIAESFRNSIVEAVNPEQSQLVSDDELSPEALLLHFDYFCKVRSATKITSLFASLPVPSLIADTIQRVIGKKTRRALINQLSDKIIDQEFVLSEIYRLMLAIQGLDLLAEKEPAKTRSLRHGLSIRRELEMLLGKIGSKTKPAEPSSADTIEMQLSKRCSWPNIV